jgi:hypothetical protein
MNSLNCILAFLIITATIPALAQNQVNPNTNTYMNEKLGQRERALAKAGGDAVKKAAKSEGIWGVGMVSSDCMESVKTGKQSPHYCLGVEAAAKPVVDSFAVDSSNDKDRMVRDWFSPTDQKNRILAYCMVFLRTTEQQCGAHYANAKLAVQ